MPLFCHSAVVWAALRRGDNWRRVVTREQLRPIPLSSLVGACAHRSAGAGPAGAVQRALAVSAGQRGAGAADRAAPGEPPQGGRPAAAAGLRHGRALAPRPVPQVRRPVHHPPAGGRDHPGRPGHGHHHAGRGAAARHHRGHRLHPGADAAPTSAARSRCWSTASPSSTRSSSATRPRPRRSARWSWRWPRTPGCW